jgi:ABC-type phosphonate transport system ATPase subunit
MVPYFTRNCDTAWEVVHQVPKHAVREGGGIAGLGVGDRLVAAIVGSAVTPRVSSQV